MSKLNPQNATAYVGPGVLRKGGKITPVPNGPLVKKKGPFKGSTLKAGGTIKKAQYGASLEQKAAAKLRKEANVRKQDSLLGVRAKKFGFENKDDYFKWQDKRNKGADQPIEGSTPSKETGAGRLKAPCQGGKCPGTNPSRNGSTIKKAKAGTMIKRKDGSTSQRGLWDNLRSKAAHNKKTGAKPKAPTKAMLTQEKKIKSKK